VGDPGHGGGGGPGGGLHILLHQQPSGPLAPGSRRVLHAHLPPPGHRALLQSDQWLRRRGGLRHRTDREDPAGGERGGSSRCSPASRLHFGGRHLRPKVAGQDRVHALHVGRHLVFFLAGGLPVGPRAGT